MRVKTLSKTSFLVLLTTAVIASCASSGGGGYRSDDVTSSYWYMVTNGKGMPRRKPGPQVVIVEPGETLYSIARAHNIDVQSLIDANNLYEPYDLQVGQQIKIPAVQYHIVEKQETIYSISKQHNVDMASLALLNNIDPPYTISVGQRLVLPGTEAGSIDWESEIGDLVYDPAGEVGSDREEEEKPFDLGSYVKETPQGRFLRPVSGRLISSFGPKAGGLHNDGINVAAPVGTPIFAADEGVVTYTGNELRGYGNLILVRHEGNWVSAYAHIHRYRVARGDRIQRGQHIADVGQTGNVTSPQLHFELRDGTNPVNPVLHLNAE